WTVIRNCAPGSNHPFVYPMATMIGYLDSYGNYTQRLPAEPGQRFEAVFTNAGDAIQAKGTAATPRAIELANTLREGTITAQLFKDGRLYASAPAIAPGGLAEFVLEPSIWIGTLSQRS
ncbi:hypothetical protein INQ23_25055, partial [Escherichia coli]|nr:hypothetical protein [Escherichia coli]